MQVTFATVLIAGAVGLGSWAVTATADMTGSAHDFAGYSCSESEVCKPCLTPHFADTSVGCLWSHEMSSLTYTLFDGSVTDPGGVDALDQYTRMCLSCHDGSVAPSPSTTRTRSVATGTWPTTTPSACPASPTSPARPAGSTPRR
ncbi:MAG: hypothetical protein ACYTA3_13385 [Planctomycetota bacterium]|jgi:hypothetical protein